MAEGEQGDLSRRGFLVRGGLVAGGYLAARRAAAADPLPRRPLGKTGVTVPVLGLGTACAGQSSGVSAAEAAAVFREALDQGLDFIDTARGYAKAEAVLGQVLAGRRDQVFLTTKATGATGAAVRRNFEESLRQLRTDHVDLLYWHGIGGLDHRGALDPEGALTCLLEQQRQGRTRFIGFTSHSHPTAVAQVLETGVIDAVMVVLNLVDRHLYDFETKLLPRARELGVAVLAMKVFGGVQGTAWSRYDGPNPGPQLSPEHLPLALRYALSLPGVSTAVVGCHTVEQVRRNLALARAFEPLTEAEHVAVEELGRSLASTWTPRFGSPR